jgi:chemotaxis protein MotB
MMVIGTAMTALFTVLWMMNAQKVKASVTGYFKDPRAYTHNWAHTPGRRGEGLPVDHHNVADVQKEIEAALHRMTEFPKVKDHIQFSMTGEGLRIDLLENEQGLFFITGRGAPTAAGERLLQLLAGEIGKMSTAW